MSIKSIHTVMVSAALLFTATLVMAQEMTVTDSDTNVLMPVNDEGDAGSHTVRCVVDRPLSASFRMHDTKMQLIYFPAAAAVLTP